MQLSIVTTLYNSSAVIKEFYERAIAAAEKDFDEFEIIFVNDGSPDDSLARARDLASEDDRVVVVDLSRNFGHHRAMMIGLKESLGEKVFLIDVDLEESPEELARFHNKLAAEACDVVYGVQTRRRGGWFERLSGDLFYSLISVFGGLDIPRNLMTVRLMTRRYVDSLLEHGERVMVISGLFAITGYEQVPLTVSKSERRQRTNYSVTRRLRLAVDFLTSFSTRPLYILFYAGLVVSGFSFLATIYFVTQFMISADPVHGWTSLISSVWLIGGMTIFILGFLGIYIAKIFEETKQRPYAVIRHIYGRAR